MESTLRNLIEKVLSEYAKRRQVILPAAFSFDLSVSRDPKHGDFSTNAAFKLAKALSQKPPELANEFVLIFEEILSHDSSAKTLVQKAVVAGGGFVNFYLTKASLGQLLVEVCRMDKRFGESKFGQERKALLEFVSANPTGPLTIAHGRQAAIGDCLFRILKATGHPVQSEYYLNDAGRQMNLLGQSLYARYCEFLGQAFEFPEEGYKGDYVRDLAKQLAESKKDHLLKEQAGEAVIFCRKYAGDEIMKDIRQDLKRMGVHFDHYFSEGTLYQNHDVEKTIEFLKKQGFIYEQDGAIWFKSTAFGDDKDRVVRKSTGEYTYLAPDIAYHAKKFQRGFNWLINFWGPDHHGYIARLKAACQALGHPSNEMDIRIVQLTTLYRNGEPVRMSTRAGEFVTLKELMDEVGVDATRFFFVMRKVESHLDFDLELAKAKSQDNPVYYLQYAYARIASLLKFADKKIHLNAKFERLEAAEERDLIRMIGEFPKILIQASESLEPYRLADYLRDLAACFHKFYSLHRIVTEDEELTYARLVLVEAMRITLRNGLELLGISQPESM